MNVAADSFREGLVARLNTHEGFVQETRWFDGSILLEVGGGQCWLKVYRGQVIDSMSFTPPLGYTFKISGSTEAWSEFRAGKRTFADLITPGTRRFSSSADVENADPLAPPAIRVEGNTMEANRIYEALFHFGECVASSAV